MLTDEEILKIAPDTDYEDALQMYYCGGEQALIELRQSDQACAPAGAGFSRAKADPHHCPPVRLASGFSCFQSRVVRAQSQSRPPPGDFWRLLPGAPAAVWRTRAIESGRRNSPLGRCRKPGRKSPT